MKKITVCIGSSCHIKGSHQVVEALKKYIADQELEDRVTLSGAFCMKNCREGVSVTVDDVLFSVTPETVGAFFEKEILAKL